MIFGMIVLSITILNVPLRATPQSPAPTPSSAPASALANGIEHSHISASLRLAQGNL